MKKINIVLLCMLFMFTSTISVAKITYLLWISRPHPANFYRLTYNIKLSKKATISYALKKIYKKLGATQIIGIKSQYFDAQHQTQFFDWLDPKNGSTVISSLMHVYLNNTIDIFVDI